VRVFVYWNDRDGPHVPLPPLHVHRRRSTSSAPGRQWSAPQEVDYTGGTAQLRGSLPGPSNGCVQIPTTGRLVCAGHWGRFGVVNLWYSDSGGASWTSSPALLPNFGEPELAVLPNGTLLINLRNHQ
jgi:hypothetical protein